MVLGVRLGRAYKAHHSAAYWSSVSADGSVDRLAAPTRVTVAAGGDGMCEAWRSNAFGPLIEPSAQSVARLTHRPCNGRLLSERQRRPCSADFHTADAAMNDGTQGGEAPGELNTTRTRSW